jgi:hypothetical protein
MTDPNIISNVISDNDSWIEMVMRITINLVKDIQFGYPIKSGKPVRKRGSLIRYIPKDKVAIPIQ